jgi:aryl-alcohol dehydrogenase-like predicted oxidoreductase
MQTTKLGNTNLQTSSLAIGSDVLGSKIDKDTAFSLLDFYVGEGGNFIDTGNFYASWLPGFKGGESETVIGEWMKSRGNRDKLNVSTKLAFDYPGSPGGLSASEIERECEMSLKRLQTDRLDLYYAHRDDRETEQEETMGAFDRLVKAGKVRALGASNLAVWRISRANAIAKANGLTPYTVIQQRYTYLRPRHGADFGPQIFINSDLKDLAATEGIALIAYSVLLSGAYTRPDRPLPPQFAGPESDERLKVLNEVAQQTSYNANQVIIAWMRQSKPAVLPIIAGSRTEQLKENIDALDLTLTDDQMKRLNTAGESDSSQGWIQTT